MSDVLFRTATPEDVEALDTLIRTHQVEGHLLPRAADEIRARVEHFVVCDVRGEIKACAELARLSPRMAEIRSLVVADDFRRVGVATRLVDELRRRAKAAGFQSLCAFTHDARVFIRHNFSIVPHVWIPEKLIKDCQGCSLFQRCGQYAMLLPLIEVPQYGVSTERPRRVAVA